MQFSKRLILSIFFGNDNGLSIKLKLSIKFNSMRNVILRIIFRTAHSLSTNAFGEQTNDKKKRWNKIMKESYSFTLFPLVYHYLSKPYQFWIEEGSNTGEYNPPIWACKEAPWLCLLQLLLSVLIMNCCCCVNRVWIWFRKPVDDV